MGSGAKGVDSIAMRFCKTMTDEGALIRRNRRKNTNTVLVRNFVKGLAGVKRTTMDEYRQAGRALVLT